MSRFDDAFRMADDFAFREMKDDAKATIKVPNGSSLELDAIEQPAEVAGAFYSGGRGDATVILLEVPSLPLLQAKVRKEGFNVIWKSRVMLCVRINWQGGTATLTLGPVSEPAEF